MDTHVHMAVYKKGSNTRVGFPSVFARYFGVTTATRWAYAWDDVALKLWIGTEEDPIPTHNTRPTGEYGQFSPNLPRRLFPPDQIGDVVFWQQAPWLSPEAHQTLRDAQAAVLGVSPYLQQQGCLGPGGPRCSCVACRIQRMLDEVAPYQGSRVLGIIPNPRR